MRSPFPGMDPWLESHWNDVHHEMIGGLRHQIAPQLPEEFFVTIEESVYVIDRDDPDNAVQRYSPDVAMFVDRTLMDAGSMTQEAVETATARVRIPDEPITEGFIEIREFTDGHPLVTAIEVLSPTNKSTTDGRSAYSRKRRAYHAAGVNLVEIDLLRGGRHFMGSAVETKVLGDPKLRTPYRALIRRRVEDAPFVDIVAISLRQRLPSIPVPLREGRPDLEVDLQPPIDLVYRAGAYGRLIDYSKPPIPPLSAEDAAWAAGLILQPL